MKPGTVGVGTPDTVILDQNSQLTPFSARLDPDMVGGRMFERVGKRFGDHEVRGGFNLRRVSLRVDPETHRDGCTIYEARYRRSDTSLGQDGGVDATGQLAELFDGHFGFLGGFIEQGVDGL